MEEIASATWRRLDVRGADTCRLLRSTDGWVLDGRADFDERGHVSISYRIDCAPDWATRAATIEGTYAHRIERREGVWVLDGRPHPGFDHLIDIDFGFTPATNFLLMKRLRFPMGKLVAVTVAWFDLGENGFTSLPQSYTRRGERVFWYESPTVNYRGTLTLAPNGFVETYPGLWRLEAAS